MTTSTRSVRSVRSALALVLLAPLIGEFLLGNIPLDVSAAVVLVPLVLLYGGGALLVREVTRRAGRGLPTMAVLALAYAIIEESLVTQTLFNPNYLDLDLLSYGALPALGMGGPWTIYVLTIHSVWSILVPIVVIELLSGRPDTPWLGVGGTVGAGVAFVLGGLVLGAGTAYTEQFLASPVQMGGAAVVAVLLAVLAFRLPASTGSAPSPAPRPWIGGVVTFLIGSAFLVVQEFGLGRQVLPAALATALTVALIVAGAVALVVWSRGRAGRCGTGRRSSPRRCSPTAGTASAPSWACKARSSSPGRRCWPPVASRSRWRSCGGRRSWSTVPDEVLVRRAAGGPGPSIELTRPHRLMSLMVDAVVRAVVGSRRNNIERRDSVERARVASASAGRSRRRTSATWRRAVVVFPHARGPTTSTAGRPATS